MLKARSPEPPKQSAAAASSKRPVPGQKQIPVALAEDAKGSSASESRHELYR